MKPFLPIKTAKALDNILIGLVCVVAFVVFAAVCLLLSLLITQIF